MHHQPGGPLTIVFLVATVVGFLGVASTLAVFYLISGKDDDNPPFSVIGKEAGIMAAGVGGLISTWAGLDSLGSAIVAIVIGAAFILALYLAVFPYARRRRELRDRAGYIGLSGTVTRAIPVGDFGEVSFRDRNGNRVRLPGKSSEPAALPTSTRVYITAVDQEFVHVASAREI